MSETALAPEAPLRFGPFEIDPLRARLTRDGEPVPLRPQSVAVLGLLAASAPRVVSKREIFSRVWPGTVVTDDSLVQCIGDIRRALHDADGSLVTTVPRQGYRLTATVERGTGSGPARSAARPSRWSTLAALLAACATFAVLAGAAAWWAMPREKGASPLSVVVLPFKLIGGAASDEYLADALTDDLTTDLSRLPESVVIARGTAFTYKGRSADPRTVHAELGVRYVVEGSIHREADRVRVNLQLVEARTGAQQWSDRIEVAGQELQAFSLIAAGRIARALHLKLVDVEAARGARNARPDAHDLAMRGWSLWDRHTREANMEARAALEKAVALDPDYAFAWIGLANTHLSDVGLRYSKDRGRSLDAAEAAIRRALAIDPKHPNVNGSLGTVLYYRSDIAAAEKAFERQIAMNRNYAPAYYWLGITNASKGDFTASLGRIDEAIALSPRDARLHLFYAVRANALLGAQQPAQAMEWARRVVALRPDFTNGHVILAAAAWQVGEQAIAREAAARALALFPQLTVTRLRSETIATQRERPDLLARWAALEAAGLPP
ncbi:winged helix-turn-helix domain-containing tetratricopeptide repeat protein [Ramlibacter albus]|uniref:Winged helix-turn-helix domain-containing protein n=1 Tax=Ramlibacter albus TaxID=2079448 RepID=A0A923S2D8_9BURK|nr:winged helix-turn-helix domain-containing protein [Ramlibacter albus]MBC5765275.1 winged helix-turn-helix domain-containing protein [Ramlibacter albus]